ncbi:hypothetical protein FZEAL_10661 [Fusarium zealandicum]|uniref:alcohol dehydrogenase (NADP(+)) n=1 Tax=Fusarium zealandicum TaxID=1053134 RepID=A0A8H4X917_9HYPO|nr:hypothetical protein FZEAL_10661 [Fusarium zealandicum]
MSNDYEFQGWLGKSPDAANGKMEWGPFEPKKWEENDVDIQITHCGVCGSDIHTLRSGWGATPYPCCVGHEIVGKAVRVGNNVKNISVGDRVGVGAQARSCLQDDCPDCSVGLPNYCRNGVINTYGSVYPDNVGKSYGGYADYNRTHSRFVVKIPEGLPSEEAAPMLCGGVTVYSPLRNNGCGPGKTVGIVGVGGLGHFGVLFAKALGADKVVGISRKASKKDEVLALGADQYIATDDDEGWAKKNAKSIDLIICTVSSPKMPITDYFKLLRRGGDFIQVGAPDGGEMPPISAFSLIAGGFKIGGSAIGSPQEIEEMLQLAVDKKVKAWVEKRPMKDANQAILDIEAGKARQPPIMPRSEEAAAFFHAVYSAVQEIPHGRVTTYGHIAMLVGTPQRPRQVGVCLKHLPSDVSQRFNHDNVPWQRVINSKGMISPRSQPEGSRTQAAALQAEGVQVTSNAMGELSVDFSEFGWFPEALPSEDNGDEEESSE